MAHREVLVAVQVVVLVAARVGLAVRRFVMEAVMVVRVVLIGAARAADLIVGDRVRRLVIEVVKVEIVPVETVPVGTVQGRGLGFRVAPPGEAIEMIVGTEIIVRTGIIEVVLGSETFVTTKTAVVQSKRIPPVTWLAKR